MAAAVITVTKRGEVSGLRLQNKTIRFFDITADTGTYTTGGFALTASQLGLTAIDFAAVNNIATSGTAGATANGIGITHASDGSSVTVQLYEGSAAGTAITEKTSNEAYEANWTFRLMVVGQ